MTMASLGGGIRAEANATARITEGNHPGSDESS
jgi:hypothetical protein